MTLSELCVELRKHLPMLGVVNLNGQLAITTGYEYPKNAAEELRPSDFLGQFLPPAESHDADKPRTDH